jgi:hypothetical protein
MKSKGFDITLKAPDNLSGASKVQVEKALEKGEDPCDRISFDAWFDGQRDHCALLLKTFAQRRR